MVQSSHDCGSKGRSKELGLISTIEEVWTALFLTLYASISVLSDAGSYRKPIESILQWGDVGKLVEKLKIIHVVTFWISCQGLLAHRGRFSRIELE